MRSTGGTFSISGVTPSAMQAPAKNCRKRSTSSSSTLGASWRQSRWNSSGDFGVNRWMVSTGEPTPAAKRALRSMPARASSSRRSTRTNAPLGQATGASAVTAKPESAPRTSASAARAVSVTAAIRSSLSTSAGMRQNSIPRQGPPSRRSAI